MLMNQRVIRGSWGSLGILHMESAYILRQQTAWQRDESEDKPKQPLVFGLESSLEENKKSGYWEGNREYMSFIETGEV